MDRNSIKQYRIDEEKYDTMINYHNIFKSINNMLLKP